jgi:hypothetical protein
VPGSVVEALAATHAWFAAYPGLPPPAPATMAGWLAAGSCYCPDGCRVAPARACRHGLVSWWLVLRCLDRPDRSDPMPPDRLLPRPGRLDPGRPDYVAVLDAHHRAVVAGQAGYPDPASGLFVMTARALWERGTCCSTGCRHCPYTGRPGGRRG